MLDLSLKSGRCGPLLRADAAPVEWAVSDGYVDYSDAVAAMEARVAAILDGSASELVWLLEHPPIYTAGVSAKADDLLTSRFPVHRTDRGGQFTYHGPGNTAGSAGATDTCGSAAVTRDASLGRWRLGSLMRSTPSA